MKPFLSRPDDPLLIVTKPSARDRWGDIFTSVIVDGQPVWKDRRTGVVFLHRVIIDLDSWWHFRRFADMILLARAGRFRAKWLRELNPAQRDLLIQQILLAKANGNASE
jgi:hypothetical protein